MLIDPKQIPQVALEFMNDDHQEAVNLVNEILTQLEQGSDEAVESALKHFCQHNGEHFAREEAEMMKYNFPPYGCHKGEHERVLAELDQVYSQWQQSTDRKQLSEYLQSTAYPWFINHLNTMDTVTAHFISQMR